MRTVVLWALTFILYVVLFNTPLPGTCATLHGALLGRLPGGELWAFPVAAAVTAAVYVLVMGAPFAVAYLVTRLVFGPPPPRPPEPFDWGGSTREFEVRDSSGKVIGTGRRK